jgi:membrane associated rhomboid family serine protease
VGWEVWVWLGAAAMALQLVTSILRHEHKSEVAYVALLVGDLALLLLATTTHHEAALWARLGFVAALVLVLGPRLVETVERRAFARDDLQAALVAARLRAILVPGLASRRRRRQVANLIEARAGGAAQVLARLDAELARSRGSDELTTLLLERATVLFMAGRFRECVDATARLPVAWPTDHPVLGLYLVRAQAELGALREAVDVLALVERGAAGRDPGALGLLTQARLTVLAFAGRQADVDRLLAGEARQLLTERAHAFLHGTARAHAGTTLPEGVAAKLDDVAARATDAARPLVRPRRAARVTLLLIAVNVALWVAVTPWQPWTFEPPQGVLIRWGALFRPGVQVGEWWRAFTAMFLHGNPAHVGLNMYALFMLGRFYEEVVGPLRYLVTYVAGGLAGAVASTLNTHQMGLSVGASGAIMGLLGAIIVVLILRRGTWPEVWRRTLLWNLVLLGALQIYIGFQLPMIDNAAHVGGMLGGGAMALVVAPGGLLGRSAAARAVVVALTLAALGGFAWAGVACARTPLAATWDKLPKKTIVVHGKAERVPTYWEYNPEHDFAKDPYLGIQIGVDPGADEATPSPKDPELERLRDHIAKTARSP